MFDDMLKKSCPYHKTPVNHALEQCDMLKKYYSRVAAKEDEAKKDGGDGGASGFMAVENVFLIFGGSMVDMSNNRPGHRQLAVLQGADGRGSSLNILYTHTLRLMGIGLDQLWPSMMPFHGVTPGKRVKPLWQIDLPVWFGTPDNFRKEILTFEVVGFKSAYHAILGRPCYSKFMVVPNYTYLKMKMSGPKGVITMGSSIEHAFNCDVECMKHTEALALDEMLVADLEKLANEGLDSSAKHVGSFEAAEQTKEVPLDPAAPEGETLRVNSTLDPK
jgi:hypothetical protein